MKEFWKPIPGFYGRYHASTLGRIKRTSFCLLKNESPTYSRVYTDGYKEKIIKQHTMHKSRYKKVLLFDLKSHLVHRLICLTWVPNTYNKPFVNHKDFNRQNNAIRNLEWVTSKENVNHAVIGGRFNRKKKFTEEK